MGIITFISSRNYIAVNRILMKEYGLHEALLLGELASEYEYWEAQGQITEDGYFYSTVENVKENTTLSDSQQRKAITSLKKKGVLDVKLKGIPAKRYFRINESALLELLNINSNNSQNVKSSSLKIEELEMQKQQTNKNNLIKKENENKNKDINIIIEYLNNKAGTRFKASSKATHQHINARLEEGFTIDDFKLVIDKKCAEWLGTDFAQYLRPVTLFGTKFEAYLNAPVYQRKQYGQSGVEVIQQQEDDLAGIF